MSWIPQIKEALPDYAKDTRLNLDSVVGRSPLGSLADGIALAAAMTTGNGKLVTFISSTFENATERDAALTAAAIMAQNNVYYPFVEMAEDDQLKGLPAGLRMNAIANHGGTTKANFEAYSLAASIVGKCHFCVKAHYDTLKKEGWTTQQLQEVGKISSVINSVAKVLNS